MRFDLFLGPSLSPADATAACATVDAHVRIRPPAEQGSLLRLLDDPPDIAGIIDGCFLQVPSLLHKEILMLLGRGTRILGAASMGALRAAELDTFGVEGIGEIYRLYKSGVIDSDDEVAVVHAPAELDWRPVTEPLVNVRFNVDRARRAGVISRAAADAVIRVARSMHFTERTYETILSRCSGVGGLREFIAAGAANLKRADALELIRTVGARLRGDEPWPDLPELPPLMTKHFVRQVKDYAGSVCGGQYVPDALVLAFIKTTDPRWRRTLACSAKTIPFDDDCLLTELKRGHHFAEARAAVAHIMRFHAEAGLSEATVARETLFGWAARRWGCSDDELPQAMRDRGFFGENELLTLARLLWLYELLTGGEWRNDERRRNVHAGLRRMDTALDEPAHRGQSRRFFHAIPR